MERNEADRIATTARINGLWDEICREIEGGMIREAIGEEMHASHIVPLSCEGEEWSVIIMLATAPVPAATAHRALARAKAQFGYSEDRRIPHGNDDGASD